MDVVVAVSGLHHIAQAIDKIAILLTAAGPAGAGIGMLNRRQDVVAVESAAAVESRPPFLFRFGDAVSSR